MEQKDNQVEIETAQVPFVQEVTEHIQQEVEKKTDQQLHEEFMNSEDSKNKALALAHGILRIVGKNWFNVASLVKKTTESQQSAFHKLQLCKMFGFAIQRIGDRGDSKKALNQVLFKIVISDKDRLEAYKRVIQFHLNEIAALNSEIAKLNKAVEN